MQATGFVRGAIAIAVVPAMHCVNPGHSIRSRAYLEARQELKGIGTQLGP